MTDFWITGVSSIVFAMIEMVCKKVFYVFLIPYCKVQDNEGEREARCRKGAFGIYKVLYLGQDGGKDLHLSTLLIIRRMKLLKYLGSIMTWQSHWHVYVISV